ncbi:E3 ubiquitin-protein ligase Zswim2 [Gaertneriomyces sp. JEL0708]|nr:E3 ubiquitin-protein ligase Zswim2 [Gaertneriomyces sp. JEL0708]
MSRSLPLRRTCPPLIAQRIEEALTLQFYVVQELGPLSFVIKERTDGPSAAIADENDDGVEIRPKSQNSGSKYKVGLGELQSCTCRDTDICVHILWILLKLFRVPKESEILYQKALVERETTSLLRGRYYSGPIVKKDPVKAVTKADDGITREIGEEDVCGGRVVKCPFCREEMGTVDDVRKDVIEIEKQHAQSRKKKVERRVNTDQAGSLPGAARRPEAPTSPAVFMSLMHLIASLPALRLKPSIRNRKPRLCLVCKERMIPGSIVRRTPCGCLGHRECVDRHLLRESGRTATCPCGKPAWEHVEDGWKVCVYEQARNPKTRSKEEAHHHKSAGKASADFQPPLELIIHGHHSTRNSSSEAPQPQCQNPPVPQATQRRRTPKRGLALPPISTSSGPGIIFDKSGAGTTYHRAKEQINTEDLDTMILGKTITLR